MQKDEIITKSYNLKEKLSVGLELSFNKLLQQKKSQNGFLILLDNGKIKKIKVADIK